MKLTEEIISYLDASVLCWLATVSNEGIPNVSPKEIFTFHEDHILIANIASPQTVKNIRLNKSVCLSFVDILVQKGFQLKGNAQIIDKSHESWEASNRLLEKLTEGKFPFASITRIEVLTSKPILSPRYLLYPETTEQDQIESARKTYGI